MPYVRVYITETRSKEHKQYCARFLAKTAASLDIDELINRAVKKIRIARGAYFFQNTKNTYGTFGNIVQAYRENGYFCSAYVAGPVQIDIEYKGNKKDAAQWCAADFEEA